MANDDFREYFELYGIHMNDWTVNFGGSDWNKLLEPDYISDGCDTTPTSVATHTHTFLFPYHIKKIYFIEGTIKGHVTFASSNCTAYITKYKVTIGKIHTSGDTTDLYTTDWVIVNKTLTWDSSYGIGEEIVFPYRIDAWQKQELNQYERIYVKVETDTSSCTTSTCSCAVLWHSNDATWEDLKITIPIRS